MKSCAACFICPGSAITQRGRKSLFPSGVTVKGKVHAHGRRFFGRPVSGRSFYFFRGYKTRKSHHVSDTMDNLKSECRREAHGR